jgi:hypothetical protein
MITNHTLLIAGSQRQYIYKITIQKNTQIRFHSKRPHTISKISMFPYTSICVWNFCVIVLSTSMYSRCIICGSGTAYPSGALEFTLGLSEVRVTRSLVLCVCFVNRSLSFGLLRFTDSDYLFGIFKLFLCLFMSYVCLLIRRYVLLYHTD